MTNRSLGFAALLAVVGVSIVFGMVVGARLNAPQVALAAPEPERRGEPIRLAPAQAVSPGSGSFADIVERAMPAVVSVRSSQDNDDDDGDDGDRRFDPMRFFFGDPEDRQRRFPRNEPSIGEGSGFVISADGYVLTNYHVVENADRVVVGLHTGREYPARVVGTDPPIDLALLKIDPDGESLPTLPLGNSSDLRVGEWVIAIGNPLEYEQTVTVGVVSAKQRRLQIGSTDRDVVNFIQTDAAINLGNSGGPLLDGAGNVIGINTAIRRTNYAEGIGFALPIDQARRVIEQLRDRGYVSRGYMGITINSLDDSTAEYYSQNYGLLDRTGALVRDVQDGGPADKVGLRSEDLIRKVDSEIVRDSTDLVAKIAAHMPGDKVELEVFRKGKTFQVTATLTDRSEGLEARAAGRQMREPDDEPEVEESTGLGFSVENLTPRFRENEGYDQDQRGVVITDLGFDSEAAGKGMRPNVVITRVNDKRIRDVGDWNEVMGDLEPGDAIKLGVLFQGRETFIFLTVPNE